VNTASKIVLGLGVIITLFGGILVGMGGNDLGESVGGLEFDFDGKELYSSDQGGNFETPGELYGINVYAVGSNETIDCDSFADQIIVTDKTARSVFDKDCNSDGMDEFDKTFLGMLWFEHPDELTIEATEGEVKVIAYGISGNLDGAGDAALSLVGGMVVLCCGIFILLIGFVMALTMTNNKQSQVTYQPVGTQVATKENWFEE